MTTTDVENPTLGQPPAYDGYGIHSRLIQQVEALIRVEAEMGGFDRTLVQYHVATALLAETVRWLPEDLGKAVEKAASDTVREVMTCGLLGEDELEIMSDTDLLIWFMGFQQAARWYVEDRQINWPLFPNLSKVYRDGDTGSLHVRRAALLDLEEHHPDGLPDRWDWHGPSLRP